MAIVRWTPTNDLAGLHSAMDRLFSDVFGPAYRGTGEEGGQMAQPLFHLPVNIAETESGYRIEAPVPGFKPEDVEITFADGVLTVTARRSEERTEEEGNYLRREVHFGSYQRQITLPGDVRADDISARFENGVLVVAVPRAPRPEPRRIQVQPGEESEQGSEAQKAEVRRREETRQREKAEQRQESGQLSGASSSSKGS
jgi:HSP20 family protein